MSKTTNPKVKAHTKKAVEAEAVDILERLDKIERLLSNLEKADRKTLIGIAPKKIPSDASLYRRFVLKIIGSQIAYFAITVSAITMIWFGIWGLLDQHFPYPVFSILLGLFIVWWYDHY